MFLQKFVIISLGTYNKLSVGYSQLKNYAGKLSSPEMVLIASWVVTEKYYKTYVIPKYACNVAATMAQFQLRCKLSQLFRILWLPSALSA